MKNCDIPHINWCRIPSINSSEELKGHNINFRVIQARA